MSSSSVSILSVSETTASSRTSPSNSAARSIGASSAEFRNIRFDPIAFRHTNASNKALILNYNECTQSANLYQYYPLLDLFLHFSKIFSSN